LHWYAENKNTVNNFVVFLPVNFIKVCSYILHRPMVYHQTYVSLAATSWSLQTAHYK